MKLNHLESTTQQHSHESVERVRQAAGEQVRRVEALEGVEGDRLRSLQQELAEIDPRAVGPFEGGERILQDAHEIAVRLSTFDGAAEALLKIGPVVNSFCQVDDKA